MATTINVDDEFDLTKPYKGRATSRFKSEDEEFALPEAPAPKPVAKQMKETFRAAPSQFEMETGMAAPEVEPTAPTAPAADKELPPKEIVDFKNLTDPKNLQIIKDYAVARFGKAGEQSSKETNEEYVKRWMTAMRQVEWNTTMNGVPELNWIYNAKKDDVLKAAKAHELYEKVPDWYEKGGQPGVRPFAEATLSLFSDPSSLVGFGVGAFGRYQAARQGIKTALKQRIKTMTAGATAEAAIGAGAAAVDAQRELELEKSLVSDGLNQQKQYIQDELEFGNIDQEEHDRIIADIDQEDIENQEKTISPTRVAFGAAVGAVVGAVEAGGAFRKPKVTTKEDLEKVLASRIKTPEDVQTQKLVEAFDADMEDTLTKFDIFEGRQVLDAVSPQTALTQAEVRKDINTRAINVARYILTVDPNFSQVKQRVVAGQQKVSDAVKDVFMSIETIDEDVLDAALNKTGLTLKEFGQATRTTVADAASIMQGYSTLAKVLKRAVQLDPEAERLVKKMYGKDQEITSAMGYLSDGIKRLERESKALVVSSIATTVRNAYGTTAGITMESASRILEGTLFAAGSALKAAVNGGVKSGVKELGTGLNMMVRDTLNTFTYLTNAGITAEVTDKLLAHNPNLKNTIFHALQESGTEDLSRVAKFVNTLNVAQDVYFRRAIFTASVERQMRRVGLDMYQAMADGKNIPPDILKNAADDALKGTFSYMPKPHKKGQNTVEAKAEGLANGFVRFWENMPGGSLVVTFPRFMTNAMAFQYKYSPLGATSGVSDMMMAAANFSKNPDKASRLYRDGLEKFSKGVIGTSAIYAAYKYRLENQDTEWFNVQNEDGSTADTRAIFPIGPYLAVGDFMAKMKLGKVGDANVSEMLEAIAGMKMPAGTQATFLNSLPEIIAAEEGKEAEKFDKALGRIIGDFFGRFIQPGQPLFAFFDQFDKESQVARDPNVLMSDDLITESALNRVQVKLPEVKEDLPPALQYLRPDQEQRVRAGEFFNILSGVRVLPAVNKLEEEFKSLNLDPFTFYGTSGDKVYDRTLITKSGPYIEKFVGKLLESDRYLNMTDAQRKLAITANMRYAMSIGRSLAQADLTMGDRARVNKMTFFNMPQRDRKAINELYAENNDGRTLDEDKAYDQVYKYQGLLSQFR
jgi:hypothetical protein